MTKQDTTGVRARDGETLADGRISDPEGRATRLEELLREIHGHVDVDIQASIEDALGQVPRSGWEPAGYPAPAWVERMSPDDRARVVVIAPGVVAYDGTLYCDGFQVGSDENYVSISASDTDRHPARASVSIFADGGSIDLLATNKKSAILVRSTESPDDTLVYGYHDGTPESYMEVMHLTEKRIAALEVTSAGSSGSGTA